MNHFIYADNAATTRLSSEALAAMMPYLNSEYGNASQPYSFARSAKKALREARETIAMCINADPEEIFFTSGGTESDNWAIKGSAFLDKDKREIITSTIEHHAILNACQAINQLGYPVSYLQPDKTGVIQPHSLKKNVSQKTRLVSIMLANNEIGTIEPIRELAMIAHEQETLFHTDAVQALGHIQVDVKELGIDMLSASAHKFNGPKGIGFLYLKKGTRIAPFMDGGAQEFGNRAGTENVASIVGMAVALKSNVNQLIENQQYLYRLEQMLLNELKGIDYQKNGSEKHIPGNMSLSFKNQNGESILHRLDLMGIAVSTGSACDSKNTQISHVLQAIGLQEEYAKGTIRISLCKNNTTSDIEKIVRALKKIVEA